MSDEQAMHYTSHARMVQGAECLWIVEPLTVSERQQVAFGRPIPLLHVATLYRTEDGEERIGYQHTFPAELIQGRDLALIPLEHLTATKVALDEARGYLTSITDAQVTMTSATSKANLALVKLAVIDELLTPFLPDRSDPGL
jgi:hypothetical protein